MSVEILYDKDEDKSVLYCNTTDWCFGPVIDSFDNSGEPHDVGEWHFHSADEMAEMFLTYMADVREVRDPRGMNKGDMWNIYADFRVAHKEHCPPK